MHELSISYATVEAVLEAIAPLRPKAVKSVRLTVGDLSGVAIEALRFAFPVAAAGTMLEQAELVIEREAVRVWCGECERESELPSLQSFLCPQCGSGKTSVRGGQDCLVRDIEVEEDEHANC